MSNGNEEITEFVAELLKKPPGPSHSVQFEIDTDGDVQALFEVLLLTMTAILKTWYPPPITIALISEEDVVRITAYFASFCVDFKFSIEDILAVFFFQAEDGIRDTSVTGVQTCALPILSPH